MTVIVTKMSGGVTQLFNTETGRVTFKCKAESALMLLDAFGGIVKFNQKGAIATVNGELTSLDFCDVIKSTEPGFKEALSTVIKEKKEFAKIKNESALQEIQELENKLNLL